MHYIHTVRTYIFTYIYSRYPHLSVCLSIPKVHLPVSINTKQINAKQITSHHMFSLCFYIDVCMYVCMYVPYKPYLLFNSN